MKQKLFSFLCALVMICSCLTLSGAVAEDQSFTAADVPENLFSSSDDSDYYSLESMVAVGSTLYASMYTSYGRAFAYWQPGMEKEKIVGLKEVTDDNGGSYKTTTLLFASDYNDMETMKADAEQKGGADADHALGNLFTDGTRLLSVNPFTGLVFEIQVDGDTLVYKDIVTMQDTNLFFHVYADDGTSYVIGGSGVSITVAGDKLLVFINDWDDNGKSANKLYIVDLATGAMKTSAVEHVYGLAGYKDGKAVVRLWDIDNSYNAETQTYDYGDVAIYDPATDTAQSIGKMDTYSNMFLYCAALDTIIYQNNTKVMGFVGDQFTKKQIGYMPVDFVSYAATIGKTYIAASYESITARDLNLGFQADQYLMVANMGYMYNGAQLFTERYPSIPVYFDNSYYADVESINQAMVSGDNTVDVFAMSITYGSFETLMKKGYCADLSGYTDLTDAISRMYPVFQSQVMKDGKLYAIPYSVYGSGSWFYDTGVLEEVGLTEDELPTNFVELCEFITRWNDEFVDEYPEYWLMEGTGSAGLKAELLSTMMSAYIDYCNYEGKDITFDTPVFREMMQAWEKVECDQIDKQMADDEANDTYRTGLLNQYYTTVGDFSWMTGKNEYAKYLPMTLTADTGEVFTTSMTVLFINPNSTHFEAAVNLLSCTLEALDDTTKYTLFTDMTEPVRNSSYDRMLSSEQEYLDSLKKQLETADEADKQYIEESIKSEEEYIEKTLPQYEFDISAEAIQYYQENVVPKIGIRKPSFLTSNSSSDSNSELTNLVSRYRGGQITLDQFIREADNKMRMMRMEDE